MSAHDGPEGTKAQSGDPGLVGCLTPSPAPQYATADVKPKELAEKVLAGDRRAVARAISLVEDGSPDLPALSARIYPNTGRGATVGLTGSPGVGKSSLAAELVRVIRARDRTVAVLAIDPTSPFT